MILSGPLDIGEGDKDLDPLDAAFIRLLRDSDRVELEKIRADLFEVLDVSISSVKHPTFQPCFPT
jgi:hypothetical protein